MSILDKLNSEQKKAGAKVNGPLLILAGAGSGKTRTITYRIAYMIQELGISPYSILAVTFTNKAAKEMRERVENLIGEDGKRAMISTFHSFGLRLLRVYSKVVGYDSNLCSFSYSSGEMPSSFNFEILETIFPSVRSLFFITNCFIIPFTTFFWSSVS